MNEHQHRLWQHMIDIIDSYLNNETDDFYRMVGELEGSLDASELKDPSLIDEWYDLWTPLEIRRAIENNHIDRAKGVEELKAMRDFLIKNSKR